ncbi:DUF1254 domain-containing protein [Falsiphaeobacter marinintestinus]|uniref:DUF1254 domain-containing protein n=1 Tax=Falsiphaeobacter marinintestinus TaxID=1492905 RepID=UPI001C96E9BC|nr:DUF1254 domain-containing protein [Phaeobacter marinintestinus]
MYKALTTALLVSTCLGSLVLADGTAMKFTTDIPPEITIPDTLETRFGTLTFDGGFPTEETAQKIYDQIDFQRAVESVLMTTPGASLQGFRKGMQEFGPDNETAVIWTQRMDSKVQLLTPNTTVVYVFMWMDTSDGPLVMEVPPNVLGIIDDHWFRYVTDFGNAGPDKGQGGKYVLLPPGYEGEVPEGHFAAPSTTYGNWLVMRGYLENGSPDPAVQRIKDQFRVYPLGSDDTDQLNMVDVSGKVFNTIHPSDIQYFHELNEIVQEEPNAAQSPEILGLLASIGIEKGKPFNPDERMTAILTEAANVGSAAARVMLYRSRDPEAPIYENSGWEAPWVGNSSTFERDGVRLLDARTRFHMYATGITPAMVNPVVGKGSQYIAGMRDADGNSLDGSKTYKVTLPPNVPAKDFWAFTLYNVQTRSMLQTDTLYPEISSADGKVQPNADGSFDIYFGPSAPEGKESNWIQTVPDMGWHMLFRLYGPEQSWFDRTWRPSEITLVE